jgi:hypothetical protein
MLAKEGPAMRTTNRKGALAAAHIELWSPPIALRLLIAFAAAFAALALLTTSVNGQVETIEPFDLTGTVVDAETGEPLVGAFVGLAGSDWGSITEGSGRFRIPDMDPGPVALTVEQLGYERLAWAGNVSAEGEELVLRVPPEPLVLEGLRIVTDRFRSRRMAAASSVFAYEREALATSPHASVLDFVTFRHGLSRIPCNGRRGDLCVRVRGRLVEPQVYVDEHPVMGGLSYLNAMAPHELQMLEVYGWGTHIRAYTPRFMERAARIRLAPIPIF